MARNETLSIPARAWTQLTNADAAAVRVWNLGGASLQLQATNGATAPTGFGGAIELPSQRLLAADLTLANLWPGVSGANRLWAFCDSPGTASVSHADA